MNLGNIEAQTLDVMASNSSPVFEPPDYLRLGVTVLKKPPEKNETVHFHYIMTEGFFADTTAGHNAKHTDQKVYYVRHKQVLNNVKFRRYSRQKSSSTSCCLR